MTGQKRRGILCILAALLSFFIVFGSLPGAGCSSSTTAGGSGSDQSGTQQAGGLGETGGGPADQSGAQASLNLDGQPVEFSINEAGAGSFERTVTDTTTGETHVEECQLTPIGSTTVGTCQDKAGGETLPCFFEYSTEGGQPTALECSNAGSQLPSKETGTIVVENNSLHADVDNDGVVDTFAIGETFAVKENNQEVAQCTTALVDDVLLARCSGDKEHFCVLRFDQAEGTTNYEPTATTCPTEGEGSPPTSTEGSMGGAGGEGPTEDGSSGSPPPCTTDADCNIFIPEAYCDLATGFCALPPGVSP